MGDFHGSSPLFPVVQVDRSVAIAFSNITYSVPDPMMMDPSLVHDSGGTQQHGNNHGIGRRRQNGNRRGILAGTSGTCYKGQLMAILGPSGAGKTTLLRALSGRMVRVPSAKLSGNVTLGACARDGVAFVEQDPRFFSCLTVEETVRFYASFRQLSRKMARAAASRAIEQVGLQRVRNSLVGGDSGGHLYAGISGGERRRLAIACEVAGMMTTIDDDDDTNRCVLLADEPTTGLDAAQADRIVAELHRLCQKGVFAAIICTLHQPRTRTFRRVQRCLFLTQNGRVAYEGSTSVKPIARHFERIGYPLPSNTNPAEFVIDLIDADANSFDDDDLHDDVQGSNGDDDTIRKGAARVKLLEACWEQRPKGPSSPGSSPMKQTREFDADREAQTTCSTKSRGHAPLLRQFRVLLGRGFRQALRDRWVTSVRAMASVGLGTLLGAALGGDGLKGGRAVQGRAALLMQLGVNAGFIAITRAITNMPKERSIVTREVLRRRNVGMTGSSGYYHPIPYFLAKLAAEMPVDAALSAIMAAVASPIAGLRPGMPRARLVRGVALQSVSASTLGLLIGAISPSAETAMAVGPCAMVASILISDMSGTFAKCPPVLIPLSMFSCIRHGYEGSLASEFVGASLDELGASAPPTSSAGAPRLPWQVKMDALMSAQQAPGGLFAIFFGRRRDDGPSTFGDAALEMLSIEPKNAYERAIRRQVRLIVIQILATAAVLTRTGGGATPEEMISVVSEPFLSD